MGRFVILDKTRRRVIGSVYENLDEVLLRSSILKTENPASTFTVLPHCFSAEEDEEMIQTVMKALNRDR